MSIRWKGAAVALLLAAGGSMAWAQMPGPGAGPGAKGGNGYGPGTMPGYGHMYGNNWGGKDFGRYGKQFMAARLDALRDTLKITDAQKPAWDAYAAAVTDARQGMWNTMRGVMRPGMMYNMTPDQRFALMDRFIALHKQSYEHMKKAAEALLPHLTPYQKGQASVLLPGLATGAGGYGMGGYGMGGYGMGGYGYGMMGGFGGHGGYGMMGY